MVDIVFNYDELKDIILESACKTYGFLTCPNLSLLEISENMTCLLKDGERKYILQVNRPGYRTEEELEGEFAWLEELNGEDGINTATVYSGTNGKILQTLVSEEGKKYFYSLQGFLPGQKLFDLDGDCIFDQMEKVGEVAARLHLQSIKRAETKKPLKALRWDVDDIVSESARWGYYRNFRGLDGENLRLLEETEAVIRQRLEEYGRNKDRYGLIHADIHANNLLIDEGKIAVIDFDDCGYGWFLYDLGSALSKFSEDLDKMAESLVKGYEKVRRRTGEDRRIIPTMIMMRRLARLGWMTTHSQKGVSSADEMKFLEKTCELAEEYIKNTENKVKK